MGSFPRLVEVGHVEDEPVADLSVLESVQRFGDAGRGEHFDVGSDAVLGAEREHLGGARGPSGARIDRITAASGANKAQLYAYFGSKEGLFDAVIADRVDTSTEGVAFDADDLPGWAVRLYDHNLQFPELARLIAWTRLERQPAGRWFDGARHESKLAAVEAAQAAGRVRAGDPADLLILLIGMASAWSPASSVYTATADEPSGDHHRRRELLRESVARTVMP